jgi:hypothetical protein
MKYGMSSDRTLQILGMDLSIPAVVSHVGQPAQFEQDPRRQLCRISMAIEYELRQRKAVDMFDLIIPIHSIWNVLPRTAGGFCDSSPLPENMVWEDWTGDGIGVR